MVMQLVPGSDPPWQKRTAVLTRDIVGFRMESTSEIVDHVALVDIAAVVGMDEACQRDAAGEVPPALGYGSANPADKRSRCLA